MVTTFPILFVAFALCQALLTMKFADLLSPSVEAGHPAVQVGAPSLA